MNILHKRPYCYNLKVLFICSCQFVLKKGGDYNVNLLDPDIPVKWDQIEEIVSTNFFSLIMVVDAIACLFRC